jgi:hypothetical protein
MRRIAIIVSLCLSIAGPVSAQVLSAHRAAPAPPVANERTVDLSAAKWNGPVLEDSRFQHLSRDAAAAESAFSSSSTITISTTVIIIALLIIILILVA